MQDLSNGESDVNSYAYAVNAAGHIAGSEDVTGRSAGGPEIVNAALWINGKITGLGTLGGENSEANGINAADQVVGYSTTRSDQLGSITVVHAFLWSGGVMKDLNQLIPPASGWFLRTALAINDAGQIVGVGTVNGQERAFLLTPAR